MVAAACAVATGTLLFLTHGIPAPGDISQALSHNPGAYTLSLGHMLDLTLASFAYLRIPLLLACVAFCVGAVASWAFRGTRAYIGAAFMMVLFFQAARLAMVVFDPYLSSRPLAEAILRSPPGTLIVDHHYYTYSSVFFYTDRTALLRNGRINNLIYGSYAPGAPDVFIDDAQFKADWLKPERAYIVGDEKIRPDLESLVGADHLHLVAASGGKFVLTNEPLPSQSPTASKRELVGELPLGLGFAPGMGMISPILF